MPDELNNIIYRQANPNRSHIEHDFPNIQNTSRGKLMLISLTDPESPDIVGELFNADTVLDDVLQGAAFNLFFSSTGSHDNTELFDLSEPPSFFGPHMVWGSVDQEGTLNLFLTPTTGDETYPFAQLHNFQDQSGQADLTRSNKLPPLVDWSVSP